MDWLTPEKKSWKQKVIEQPHQLFFPSAIVFSLIIMIMTFISLIGKIEVDFSMYHGFGLIYALFTNAFLGFLFIVIPKYTNSLTLKPEQYLYNWAAIQIGVIVAFIGFSLIGKLIVSFSLIYASYTLFNAIKKGSAADKKESIWLVSLIAYGAVLLLIDTISGIDLNLLSFYTYMVALVIIVAQKMVPAFFAVYSRKPLPIKPKYTIEILFITLLGIGVSEQFDISIIQTISSALGAIFLGYLIGKINILQKSPAILWILALGFIWAEIGFVSLFIESLFIDYSLKLSLHIFAIGFVTTLLIGFGSRVTLGHSNQQIKADKLTVGLFILTQIVVLVRIFASISTIAQTNFSMPMLHLSSTLWIILFIVWALRYGKTLLRIEK